jgi:hypothetical protein
MSIPTQLRRSVSRRTRRRWAISGGTTFFGLDDAAWAKYQLGEFLPENDPATGKPGTKNPWRSSPTILGVSARKIHSRSLRSAASAA